MMDFEIAKPRPEALISLEEVKAYWDTMVDAPDGQKRPLENALDYVSNAMISAAGLQLSLTHDADVHDTIPTYLPLLSRDKLNYQGLSDLREIHERWKIVNSAMRGMHDGSTRVAPPTKLSTQRVLNDVYNCLDAAPENTKAAAYRELLQQAAQIFGIPPLEQDVSRRTESKFIR